jgi:hypothetical protein
MIMDYRYQPGSLTVAVGDSVTWTNHDQARHDVSGTSGPAGLQSPELGQGESWTHTFTQPGAYAYLCRLHPEMTATLTVEPAAPAPTTPAPSAPPSAPGPGPSTPAASDDTSGDAAPLPVEGQPAAPTTTAAGGPTSVAPGPATSAGPLPAELAEAAASGQPASTRLPPLGVAAAVTAVVLACTFALLGGRREPAVDETPPGDIDDTLTLPDDDPDPDPEPDSDSD